MKTLLQATALATMLAAPLLAQDGTSGKAAIMVFPFAMSRTTVGLGPDIGGQLARRAVAGAIASKKLFVKDSTSSERLNAAVRNGTGPTTFGAVNREIQPDKEYRSNYLLIGYIEGVDAKQVPSKNPREVFYAAALHVTLTVQDVETHSVVASKLVDLTNGFMAPDLQTCSSFDVVCKGKNKAKELAAEKANATARAHLPADGADTPAKAMAAAAANMTEAILAFLSDGFATGALK